MDESTTLPAKPAMDRLAELPKPTSPVGVRERLIELTAPRPRRAASRFRPETSRAKCCRDRAPRNWYLTGYLGPRRKTDAARRLAAVAGSEAAQEEVAEDLLEAQRGSEGMEDGATGKGVASRRRLGRAPARALLRTLLARPHRAAAPRRARTEGARHLGRLCHRATAR